MIDPSIHSILSQKHHPIPAGSGDVIVLKKNPLLCRGSRKALARRKNPPNGTIRERLDNRKTQKPKGGIQMDDNSLAHTQWNCKYHIVFAPKYRRKSYMED